MTDLTRTRLFDRPAGPALLTITGLMAAFGAASCCGIPLMLAGLGLSSAWLGGIALLAAPNRPLLLVLGLLGLGAGAFASWRQSRAAACAADSICAKPAYRAAVIVALAIGAGFLYLGYFYA